MIEVRYAGVVVGRSAIVRQLDTRGLFLGITEPLPVGTPVVLHISGAGTELGAGQEVAGKVVAVSESQELSHAGMRVRFADPAAAALFGTPEEAPPEPEPVAAPVRSPQPEPAVGSTAVERAVAAPEAAVPPQPSGHRRIVVDASSERVPDPAAPSPDAGEGGDAVDHSGATTIESGRIPAPDPSALGGGGGKRNRRHRRR